MAFIERQGGPLDREPVRFGAKARSVLGGGRTPVYEDIHLLYPMLTFTRMDTQHPDVPEEDAKLFRSSSDKSPVYHYECKHFDGSNCTIYDVRPRMCSGFAADSQGCGYKSCTWGEATKRRADWREARKPMADQGEASDMCEKMEDS